MSTMRQEAGKKRIKDMRRGWGHYLVV